MNKRSLYIMESCREATQLDSERVRMEGGGEICQLLQITYYGHRAIYLSKSFFFFFLPHHVACRILPHEGLNLCLLQWKHGVLTTGPPGKSSAVYF